jgi:hypothetical protein
MPSSNAQNPHSSISAIAVSIGQAIARIPNTMPPAPRATIIFQLDVNSSRSMSRPPWPPQSTGCAIGPMIRRIGPLKIIQQR